MNIVFLTAIVLFFAQGISASNDSAKALNTAVIKEVPTLLSKSDKALYSQIFKLQEKGQWKRAQRLINKIDNKLLLGHVDYQKLMHPKKYRSKYHELAAWMSRYADHPYAWQVYSLAKRRQGKAQSPRRPVKTNYPGVTGQSAPKGQPTPFRKLSQRRHIANFKRTVRRYIRRGRPEYAEKRFWGIERTDLLTNHELADVLSKIASSYYYEGNDEKATALAVYGSELSSATEPLNDWVAGLAYYRQYKQAEAFTYFEKLANSEVASEWLLSAGQFWASRTAYQLRNVESAEKYLKRAASHKETFYGLIAGYQMGVKPQLDWTLPSLQKTYMDDLNAYPAVRRAIALVELGRDDLADEELRLFWGRQGVKVQKQLIALTAHLNLPAIQIRLGYAGGLESRAPAAVRYPVPDWAPADGLRIDRALLFAMVRKESGFKSKARSHAGARGLMQVMPATARVLSRKNKVLRRNRHRLSEPEYNMALGQQYVEYLGDMDYTESNMLMLLAAYNGGPGSLIKWRKGTDYHQDPLLFIESIGFYETRDYIERVMANLWLYRHRLGQEAPTLEALAEGAWPVMIMQDTEKSRKQSVRRMAGEK